jgi:hypothetical protein
MPRDAITAEQVARLFHEAYERLAPSHGYETRKASAVPWDDVPEPNRSLMIAVAAEVAPVITAQATAAARDRIRAELRNRAASERDEAITSRSPSAAERHIHAAAALDAAADLLDGGAE